MNDLELKQVRSEVQEAVYDIYRATGRVTNHEYHVAATTAAELYDVAAKPEHAEYARELAEDYTLDCPAGCDRETK
jgi:hypothetical protein